MQIQQLSYEATDLQLVHADSPATDYVACLCKLSQMQINFCQHPVSSIKRVGFSLNYVEFRVNSKLAVCFSCYEGQQV